MWAMQHFKLPEFYMPYPARLSPNLEWSAFSLRKIWNQVKALVALWWANNSKEAYASGLANLATALSNWNDSRTGTRQGSKVRGSTPTPQPELSRTRAAGRWTTGGSTHRDAAQLRSPSAGTP